MRCPDCNKFVSFDTETEPEIDGLNVDEEGVVTADVRIVNTCAECGTELTEANFELAVDLQDACEKHVNAEGETKHELEVEVAEATRTERTDGRPGAPARYRQHLYGALVTVTVTCACDAEFEATDKWEDDIQSSAMDEV